MHVASSLSDEYRDSADHLECKRYCYLERLGHRNEMGNRWVIESVLSAHDTPAAVIGSLSWRTIMASLWKVTGNAA